MRTRVRVVSAGDFQAWANQQQGDIKAAQDAVQEAVGAGTAPGVAS
jgi:heme/copper-type cytochrome/quinol oxidase subunit 2